MSCWCWPSLQTLGSTHKCGCTGLTALALLVAAVGPAVRPAPAMALVANLTPAPVPAACWHMRC